MRTGIFTNYKYYITKNKVIAVSSFAGKTVRGVAICADQDKFDIEKGKQLASARCNEKVSKKRLCRANKEYKKAQENFNRSLERLTKMRLYVEDSYIAYNSAAQLVDKITEEY